MALFYPDGTLDAALSAAIGDAVTRADLCTAAPANYAGIAAVTVANVTGLDSSDFTISNGDTSGRKIRMAAQDIESASGGGTADHVALSDGTTLICVLTLASSQVVTSGNPVTIGAVDVLELPDPVAE